MSTAKSFDKDISDFIKTELNGVKDTLLKKFNKNMENRKNNPFCSFNKKEIIMYMMAGRSFDSQLGTRLQHIAMYMARKKYGAEYVPNLIVLSFDDKTNELVMKTVTDPITKGTQQKIMWAKSLDDATTIILNKRKKHLKNNPNMFKEYRFDMDKKTASELPNKVIPKKDQEKISSGKKVDIDRIVDLLYIYGDKKNKICSFEIKAGGNLDTKNSVPNIDEVDELRDLFFFFGKSEAYFATCYNNMGEGNEPQGYIFTQIDRKKQLRGSEFWDKILPEKWDYSHFIDIYRKCFNSVKLEAALKDTIKRATDDGTAQ